MFNGSKYSKLLEERNELAVKLNQSTQYIDTLHVQINDNKNVIETLTTSNMQLSASVDAYKIKLTETENKVNNKANLLLASIGVKDFAPENLSSESTTGDVVAQFHALSGGVQTEFYKKNKERLSRALNIPL